MTTSVLTKLNEMRDSYSRRRALWRELSAYNTDNDLNDLEAAIDRSNTEGDPRTLEVRRILAAQRNAIALRRG
jgi:hypothetical protein